MKITKKLLLDQIDNWAELNAHDVSALWDHVRAQEIKGANQALEIKTLKAMLTESTRVNIETAAAIQSRLNTLDTVCALQADRLYKLTLGATTGAPSYTCPAQPYTADNDPKRWTVTTGVVTAGTSRIEPSA